MDKIEKIMKEMRSLEAQRESTMELIEKIDKRYALDYQKFSQEYTNFYMSKRNTEFVLYDKYPSNAAIALYLKENELHPLTEFGTLNVKELAEIIKYLYQFKTGKESQILTIGTTDTQGDLDSDYTIAHMNFIVGTKDVLSKVQEFAGGFYCNKYSQINDSLGKEPVQGAVNIELAEQYINTLGIECSTGIHNALGYINYYRPELNHVAQTGFSLQKQVIGNTIKMPYERKIEGIKDVFTFGIHRNDSYIARVLMSIIIYKKNNSISELTSEDYNHIFEVLYGEKVSIKEDASNDFPKSLVYHA